MERIETPAVAPAAEVSIDINAALEEVTMPVPTAQAVPVPESVVPTVPAAVPPAAQPEMVLVPVEIDEMNISPEPVDASVADQVKNDIANNESLVGTEIASIKSAYWGGFIKVIETVAAGLGSEDIVSIDKGHLLTTKDGGVIKCDLTTVFGTNTWDMKNPNLNLKLMKLIQGGDKVTILEDAVKNTVYSSTGAEILTIATFTKPDTVNFSKVAEVDPGVLKTKTPITIGRVSNLAVAKQTYGSIYYNITIDKETYEILSIDVDEKYKEVFKSETGRETFRYKVKELFPVKKSDTVIIELYDKAGQLFIRTTNDVTMTTIYFQIAAMKNEKRDDLSFDDL